MFEKSSFNENYKYKALEKSYSELGTTFTMHKTDQKSLILNKIVNTLRRIKVTLVFIYQNYLHARIPCPKKSTISNVK